MSHKHLMMMLLLISGSTASANDPDISAIAQMVSFAPVTTPMEGHVRLSCVGTLIDTATIVTASHCLPASLQYIAVQCLDNIGAKTTIAPVISLRHHNKQDVVVVRFQAQRKCHNSEHPLLLSHADNRELAIYSQRSLQLHSVGVLQSQPYNYIVSDASCQTQGDSGAPVFAKTPNGDWFLSAMLISGTADCPSLQILAKLFNLQTWLFDRTDL